MTTPTLEEATPAESSEERAERRLERRINRPKIVPDRRRYRRVPVSVFGRFMRDDKQEYPCEVINMSAGGMALLSPVACADQERIVAYLDKFGRIEGVVVRSFEGGFAVRILASPAKCEKIANSLTWITNEKALGPDRQTLLRARRGGQPRLEADLAERRGRMPAKSSTCR